MGELTNIAWTDHTFNPWMGCTKVSEGCRHCYAETLTKNRMGLDLWGPKAARQVTKAPWNNVKKWNAEASSSPGVLGAGNPHLCFTGSLMDWAEDRDDLVEPRQKMWELVRTCRNLHFQMLTKRPENIRRLLPADWGDGYPNVWIGTTIEDMRVASRADHLRQIPAVVRFVSYEPAIGPLHDLDLTDIDWVIYGGESGPGFRPHDLAWPRAMRDACAAAGVAYFYKQSSAIRTEMGIHLDGELIRKFPTPRIVEQHR
jgi:protein gp37